VSIRPTAPGGRGAAAAALTTRWQQRPVRGSGWRRPERQPFSLSCVRRRLGWGLARADSHRPTNLSRNCHSREWCHPPVALPVAPWHTRTRQGITRFWAPHSTLGAGVPGKREKLGRAEVRSCAATGSWIAVRHRADRARDHAGEAKRSRDRATDQRPPHSDRQKSYGSELVSALEQEISRCKGRSSTELHLPDSGRSGQEQPTIHTTSDWSRGRIYRMDGCRASVLTVVLVGIGQNWGDCNTRIWSRGHTFQEIARPTKNLRISLWISISVPNRAVKLSY